MNPRLILVCNDDLFSQSLVRNITTNHHPLAIVTNQKELTYWQEKQSNEWKIPLLILCELNWQVSKELPRVGFMTGYEVAQYLLVHTQVSAGLAFISAVDRNRIITDIECKGLAREMARLFDHLLIPLPIERLLEYTFQPISEAKQVYIRDYLLHEAGQLDRLNHQLRDAIHEKKINRKKLQEKLVQLQYFFQDTSQLPYSLIRHLSQHVEQYTDIQLKSEVETLMHFLQKIYQSRPHSQPIYNRLDGAMMIVEDNPEQLNTLLALFNPYFTEVKGFKNGKNALAALEKNADKFIAAIVDVELMESQGRFWQPIQGIEVLEMIATYTHIIPVGLSRLSKWARRTIGERLGLSILPKSPNTILPAFLSAANLVKEIEAKRKTIQKDAKKPYPRPPNKQIPDLHEGLVRDRSILCITAHNGRENSYNLRDIQESIRAGKHRDSITLIHAPGISPREISRSLLDHNPTVLHLRGFDFHAENEQDELSNYPSGSVNPDALTGLARLFHPHIQCLVLDQCKGDLATFAQNTSPFIPSIIAIDYEATHEKSVSIFVQSLYDAVAAGYSFPFSFNFALKSSQLNNQSETGKFTLYQPSSAE